MNPQKKYNKARLLKETIEAYKSILIAEGFLDVLVDLVFGRQIAKAGNALAKDPEYIKSVKKLKQLEIELQDIHTKYEQVTKNRLAHYFIVYGIDLFDLDAQDQFYEMAAIDKKFGKYKNIKPLDKKQQDLNRKLVSKK